MQPRKSNLQVIESNLLDICQNPELQSFETCKKIANAINEQNDSNIAPKHNNEDYLQFLFEQTTKLPVVVFSSKMTDVEKLQLFGHISSVSNLTHSTQLQLSIDEYKSMVV